MASTSASKGIVVLATDNSQSALSVVDFALKHYDTGYELHVVHVQPVHKNMMNHADEDYAEAGVKASDTKAHEGKATDLEVERQSFLLDNILPKFDALAAREGPKQPARAAVIYVPNNTAHAIGKGLCRYAKDHNAEKLVIQRSSKAFLTNFFLGSVASYCASHSPVPLVIVQ